MMDVIIKGFKNPIIKVAKQLMYGYLNMSVVSEEDEIWVLKYALYEFAVNHGYEKDLPEDFIKSLEVEEDKK